MKIDDKTIEKLADLSKLEFTAEEQTAIKGDLEKILEFVEKLDQVDTDGVEPLIFMTDEQNDFREDEAHLDITQAEALKNAPKKDAFYFKVPKVLDKG